MPLRQFLLLFFFINLSSLALATPYVQLESEEAVYDNHKIHLKKNVHIEHPLGTIECEDASLTHKGSLKELELDCLLLENQVHITFKDRAFLKCERAFLDYEEFSGHFFSPAEEPVLFNDRYINHNQEESTLTVHSRELHVDIIAVEQLHDVNEQSIDDMEALGNVHILFSKEFIAQGEKAQYQRQQKSAREHEGLLILEGNETSLCRLLHIGGDSIEGSKMSLDYAKQIFKSSQAQGVLKTLDPNHSDPWKFTTKQLIWNYPQKELVFKKTSLIEHPLWGSLKNNGSVTLSQDLMKDEWLWRHIYCKGKTTLSHAPHQLTSHSILHLDHFLKKAWITKSEDVPLDINHYLHYEDPLGTIVAQEGEIIYHDGEDGITIEKITLKGDVRLKNTPPPKEGAPATSQLALADELVYYPKEGLAILSALPSKQVIYLDEVNDVQVGAPKIELQRLSQKQTPLIKASGHVRARLNPNELNDIKLKF